MSWGSPRYGLLLTFLFSILSFFDRTLQVFQLWPEFGNASPLHQSQPLPPFQPYLRQTQQHSVVPPCFAGSIPDVVERFGSFWCAGLLLTPPEARAGRHHPSCSRQEAPFHSRHISFRIRWVDRRNRRRLLRIGVVKKVVHLPHLLTTASSRPHPLSAILFADSPTEALATRDPTTSYPPPDSCRRVRRRSTRLR